MLKTLKTRSLSSLSIGIYFLILFLLLFGMIMVTYNMADTAINLDIDNTDINAVTYIY